ncbi:MAG: hypothetical protein OEY00_02045 [Gammaproteobacteria bacterium]|nr:hypothetical protein [Gammaproteobacteria bacterium]
MKQYNKNIKWLYRAFSAMLFGYGVKTIITQEISAEGGRLSGAAWALNGTDAMILGTAIAVAGAYMFLVTFTEKK